MSRTIAILILFGFPILSFILSAVEYGRIPFGSSQHLYPVCIIILALFLSAVSRLRHWYGRFKSSTLFLGIFSAYLILCLSWLWFAFLRLPGRSLAYLIYLLIAVPLALFEWSRSRKDIERSKYRIRKAFFRAWLLSMLFPIVGAGYVFLSTHDVHFDQSHLGSIQLSAPLVDQFHKQIDQGLVVELYVDPSYSFESRIRSFFEPLFGEIAIIDISRSPERAARAGFTHGAKLKVQGVGSGKITVIDFPVRRSDARDVMAGLETRLAAMLATYRTPPIDLVWRDSGERKTDLSLHELAALSSRARLMEIAKQEIGEVKSPSQKIAQEDSNRLLWLVTGFSNLTWTSQKTLLERIRLGDSCFIAVNRLHEEMKFVANSQDHSRTLKGQIKLLLETLNISTLAETIVKNPRVRIDASAADRHYVLADKVYGHEITAAVRRNLQHAPRLLFRSASPLVLKEGGDKGSKNKHASLLFSSTLEKPVVAAEERVSYVLAQNVGEGRLILAADSDFLGDKLIDLEANQAFLRMALRWLQGVELSRLDQYHPSDVRIIALQKDDRFGLALMLFGFPVFVMLIGLILFIRKNIWRPLA